MWLERLAEVRKDDQLRRHVPNTITPIHCAKILTANNVPLNLTDGGQQPRPGIRPAERAMRAVASSRRRLTTCGGVRAPFSFGRYAA